MVAMVRVLFFLFVVLLSAGCDAPAIHHTTDEQAYNNDSAANALLSEYHSGAQSSEINMAAMKLAPRDVDFSALFPVFADNCVPCHSPEGNAPFCLNSYAAISRKSAVIKDVMLQRLMPPFLADPRYSHLVNAPRINDSVRGEIIRWIDHGAKPAKSKYTGKTGVSQADSVTGSCKTFRAKEHTISSNSDSYQCFVIDLDLKTDTFVNCLRYHSTNKAAIHHIMVYLDTGHVLGNSPDCWDCMKNDIVNKLIPIDSWSRGMLACKLTDGFAFKFPKGSKLLLQTHYGDEGNKGQHEQTTIDLFYSARPTREVKFEIINKLDIFLPANKVKTESLKFKTDSAISLIGCVPHMHFLAKKIEIFAITPDLRKINILKINNWDYLWQGSYFLSSLVQVPAHSSIYMNAVFDNTTNNPQQPNDPVRDVKYDTYSNEEMMVLCLYTVPWKSSDEYVHPTKIFR